MLHTQARFGAGHHGHDSTCRARDIMTSGRSLGVCRVSDTVTSRFRAPYHVTGGTEYEKGVEFNLPASVTEE